MQGLTAHMGSALAMPCRITILLRRTKQLVCLLHPRPYATVRNVGNPAPRPEYGTGFLIAEGENERRCERLVVAGAKLTMKLQA